MSETGVLFLTGTIISDLRRNVERGKLLPGQPGY
jgi:hypothetical protein